MALVDLLISNKVSFTVAEYARDFVTEDVGLDAILLRFLLGVPPPDDGLAM